jgi:hypothetical protein
MYTTERSGHEVVVSFADTGKVAARVTTHSEKVNTTGEPTYKKLPQEEWVVHFTGLKFTGSGLAEFLKLLPSWGVLE